MPTAGGSTAKSVRRFIPDHGPSGRELESQCPSIWTQISRWPLKNGGNAIDAINPDLSKFKARGGKLILYHGWADPGPAPENTINYVNAVNKQVAATTATGCGCSSFRA